MNVLVTGGAGYIGSVVTKQLVQRGHMVVVVDNLVHGYRTAVVPGAILIEMDLGDREQLDRSLAMYSVDAVVHLAAEIVISTSLRDPATCFNVNIGEGLVLLNAVVKHEVAKFIFSSSCAVYGEALSPSLAEEHPLAPVSPYGESKLAYERMLHWYAQAYGLQSVSLRYFNAAGASGPLGEDHRPVEPHLIPNIMRVALGRQPALEIYGDDYPTDDGTAIRDYIHVTDIAAAHVLALEHRGPLPKKAYNLGNGRGFSVREVIEAVGRIAKKDITTRICARRPGDPPMLIADATAAQRDLGWQPAHSGLEEILESAWRWCRSHPNGHEG